MKTITVCGIGVATSIIESVSALGLQSPPVDKEAHSRLESPASWAVAAVEQAWHMARLDGLNHERIGLLYSSVWGSVTATVDYLESLQQAGGRYASPRHFTRSTYASTASSLGIAFQIHGPCETLSFDEFPISGGLDRARRLLAAGRCDAVVVCWADDSAPIITALARLAVEKLHRREFARFSTEAPGAGAVAMVVSQTQDTPLQLCCEWTQAEQSEQENFSHPPYPTDGALKLAAAMNRAAKGEQDSVLWTELGTKNTSISLKISAS